MIVGFTNGCFDILHPGHTYLLAEAAKQCDTLIVGLNTDESIRQLKNGGRPVNNYVKREAMLLALPIVGEVLPFSSDEGLLGIIESIRPHVLFKGADYQGKKVVGEEYMKHRGGKVVLIPLLPGYSTTRIIENG